MSKIDGIYCVLIKADLKTLVLLNKKQNIVLKIAIFIFAVLWRLIYKGRLFANYITMEISSNWIEIVQNNENTNTSLHIVLFIYQLLSLLWGSLFQVWLFNSRIFSNIYSQLLFSILILRIN